MERAAACGALEMVTSFAENLEFTAAGVNKGTAVQALSARLGLGPEQVMAFGDAGNDLELLAWAGWSFAMANASAEAKKAARYETGSNRGGRRRHGGGALAPGGINQKRRMAFCHAPRKEGGERMVLSEQPSERMLRLGRLSPAAWHPVSHPSPRWPPDEPGGSSGSGRTG